MGPSQPRPSFYERFAGGFVREPHGDMLLSFGPSQHIIKSSWSQIQHQTRSFQDVSLKPDRPVRTVVEVDVTLDNPSRNDAKPVSRQLALYELPINGEAYSIGIALTLDTPSTLTAEIEQDLFFASMILTGTHLSFNEVSEDLYGKDHEEYVENTTNAIVDHFSTSLRYVAKGDMWDQGGRDVFRDRIRHFVSQGMRIELSLPAFPCKSSNLGKAQGTSPDRGEYIALLNLYNFIQAIERIYEPGAKLWIISDGHVFSDCIGVDDAAVDDYAMQLIAMNDSISLERGDVDRIGFKSLIDMFTALELDPSIDAGIPQVEHFIATKLTQDAETCRRILKGGFQLDASQLREKLDTNDSGIIALYRGFSKFMLEDLAQNPYTSGLSQSKRRKVSSKVAFEMIQRNQAYSNLVEIMFPHHVRLSIHAHNNAGPKFGIQMLGSGVRSTNVLSPDGDLAKSCDHLHVPTPWHNCIVEIQGHPQLYITKSSIVQSALATGDFTGGWTETRGKGAYFYLKPAV